MNTKWIYKKIKKISNIKNNLLLNFYSIIVVYLIVSHKKNSKQDYLEIIKAINYLDIDLLNCNQLVFVKQLCKKNKLIESQKELKKIIEKYLFVLNKANGLKPILFDKDLKNIQEIKNINDSYIVFLDELNNLFSLIIQQISFDYSIIIEITRNSLINFIQDERKYIRKNQ